jgi:WD40 repeat protein
VRTRILILVIVLNGLNSQAQIKLSNTFSTAKHQIVCSAFSPDSKYIATGGFDKKIIIRDALTGSVVKELTGLKDFPLSLVFSFDGNYLISGGKDAKVTVWNLQTGKNISLSGHTSDVTSVDITRSNHIASASKDKTIRIWDIKGTLISKFAGHTKEVNSVQFNYDGTRLVSGGADGKVIEWDVNSATLIRSIEAHDGWTRCVAFNYNGTLIASGGDDGKIQIWNSSDGKLQNSIIAHSKWVQTLAFSPDGKYIVSGGHDNYLVLINSSTGSIVFHSPKQDFFVLSVAFNLNGRNFISSTLYSEKLHVWDASPLGIQNLAGNTEVPRSKPLITWNNKDNLTSDKLNFKIDASLKSESEITSIDIYLNDKKFSTDRDFQKDKTGFDIDYKKIIYLNAGDNKVRITAYNAGGETTSTELTVKYTEPKEVIAPPVAVVPKSKPSIIWKTGNNLKVDTLLSGIGAQIKSESPVSSIDIFVNNKKYSTEKITQSGKTDFNVEFEKTINLAEGLNTVRLIARNEGGESTSDILNLTYLKPEKPVPPPEIIKPKTKAVISWMTADNKTVDNILAKINASVKSESKVSSIDFYLNNVKISSEKDFKLTGPGFNINLDKSVNLNEGMNSLKLVAVNEAGESISDLLRITYTKPKELIAAVEKKPEEKPAEPVIKTLEKPVEPVTKPAEKTAEPVAKPAEKPVEPVAKPAEKPAAVVTTRSFPSSFELLQNLPKNSPNSYRYALIIGNEDYSSFQTGLQSESNVQFAAADAKAFKEYAISIMGVPEDNVMFLINARAIEMDNNIGKLNPIIKALGGKAEIIVFYAGHGYPDEQTKEPYLIPVDVSGTNLKFAIKLKDLYTTLTEFPSKRITLFIDACFSGGAREQGLLSSRGVRINPKSDVLSGNVVVFTASSGSESALPYKEKEHGMFTYFLLAKLKETGGKITYKELSDYITEQVGVKSVLINNKPQTPQTNVSLSVANSWASWMIE